LLQLFFFNIMKKFLNLNLIKKNLPKLASSWYLFSWIWSLLLFCICITVFLGTPLQFTVILCTPLQSTVLLCIPLQSTVLICTPLQSTVLLCTPLQSTVLLCTPLQSTVYLSRFTGLSFRVSHETWHLVNSFECLLPYILLNIKER